MDEVTIGTVLVGFDENFTFIDIPNVKNVSRTGRKSRLAPY